MEKIVINPPNQGDSASNAEEDIVITPTLEHDIVTPELLKGNIISDELNPEHKEKLGYFAGSGAILYGFSGVGKTSQVKKLAIEHGAKIVEIHKEMSVRQIKKAFEVARKIAKEKQPVYIVLDEIDGFGRKEYAQFTGGTSKINALLKELDGVKNNEKAKNYLYTFGLTNHLENVDQRLMRPGRLEELLEIPLPNREERQNILKMHGQN